MNFADARKAIYDLIAWKCPLLRRVQGWGIYEVIYRCHAPTGKTGLNMIGARAAFAGLWRKHVTAFRRPQLLVDISVLWRRDAGTGIQRVVRALSEELLKADIGEYELRFVAATPRRRYRYLEQEEGGSSRLQIGGRINARAGDVFLGLDLSSRILPRHERQIKSWRNKGVRISIVIYDLLPAQHPEWFGEEQSAIFVRWLDFVGRHADQALCISRTVSQDLDDWLRRGEGARFDAVDIHAFPLGGDLRKSRPTEGMSHADTQMLAILDGKRFVLIVGTIEPRKGHAVALDAFDHLYASGHCNIPALVVVGRPGWHTEDLQQRMRSHYQSGDNFFWFEDASDELLDTLYQRCAGVLFPTFAEGFGLPVAEALAHGQSILVRDLPVFRELSSPLISYFNNDTDVSLSQSILLWLENIEKEERPCKQDALTWQKSCEALLGHLEISNRSKF